MALDFRPYRITHVLGVFDRPQDRWLAHRAIRRHLWCLTENNVDYLRAYPETPPLYQSGVRYEEEPPGQEDWQDVRTTLALGYGDCEDLACWRCAELRIRSGIHATPHVVPRHRPGGGMLFHIQSKWPCLPGLCLTPRVEDPSRRLGMR